MKIVMKYLNIVEKFYPVNVVFNFEESDSTCHNCGSEEIITNNNLVKECCDCGLLFQTFVYDDVTAVNKKYQISSDEEERAIRKKLDQFQGKSDTKLPEGLFAMLDGYFNKIGFSLGEEIKKLPLDMSGMSQGTNVEMMREALKSVGYPNMYKEVYRICRDYWGWKLHDISNITDLFISTHFTAKSLVKSIKGDRSSDPNSDYWFYRILEMIYMRLDPNYFHIIKTDNSFNYHEDLWSRICQTFEWPKPKPL